MEDNYEEFEKLFMDVAFVNISNVIGVIKPLMDTIVQQYKKLSHEEKKEINIDEMHFFNIGITMNNKIVEINRQFINKDLPFFYGSNLKDAIIKKLFDYCNKALEQLRDLLEILNYHNLNSIQLKLANVFFKNYLEINNKIFNFNLPYNLVECFDSSNGTEMGNLDAIKNELNALGLEYLYIEIEQNINNSSNQIVKK